MLMRETILINEHRICSKRECIQKPYADSALPSALQSHLIVK